MQNARPDPIFFPENPGCPNKPPIFKNFSFPYKSIIQFKLNGKLHSHTKWHFTTNNRESHEMTWKENTKKTIDPQITQINTDGIKI